jgi:LmbE family N-acetylglucosaminyl deacetylase
MSSERARTVKAFLRAANGLGSRGAEALWASTSALVGKLPRRTARQWASSGRERVIVFAAHADDDAMGCAGTAIRHKHAGDSVRITLLTDGSRSRAFGLDPVSMRQRREKEARQAAAEIGAHCDWIGLREGEWPDAEGRAAIRRTLLEADPTVIYAPSGIDYQSEHCRLARLLGSILFESGLTPEIRIYAVQVPLTPLLINLVHDVSDLDEAIRSVLACYPTQSESVSRSFRLRRYAARFYGAAAQVEGFCSLPAGLYASLHRRPQATFRALYLRAWSDPLALMVGARERTVWRRKLKKDPHGCRSAHEPGEARSKPVYGD